MEFNDGNKINVSNLYIYPIKSCHELCLDESKVNFYGLENDRILLIIMKSNNSSLTIRTHPKMYEINARIQDNLIKLNIPNYSELFLNYDVPDSQVNLIKINLWDIPVDVTTFPEGEAINKCLSEYLSEDVLLVKPLTTRKLTDFNQVELFTKEFKDTDYTYFADLAPILVISEESFNFVSNLVKEKTGEELQLLNFRPNIVLKGGKKEFWEDGINRIKIGNVILRRIKGCVRCKLTTYDLKIKKFRLSKEPLEVLNDVHYDDQLDGVVFGQNFCVDLIENENHTIRIGDHVEILA